MKIKSASLLSLSVIAVSTLFFATSCKKDNGPGGAAAQLNATVGASSFKPTGVVAFDHAGWIDITGTQFFKAGDSLALDVLLPDTVKPGQVIDLTLDRLGTIISYYNLKDTVNYSTDDDRSRGTITISSNDKTNKKISGSFSATLYGWTNTLDDDSLKVTGNFNTTYIGL